MIERGLVLLLLMLVQIAPVKINPIVGTGKNRW
jgi:hypothetical protein